MTLVLNTSYDNPANFTFDSNVIEVDGSGARLVLEYFPQQDFSEDFTDDTGFVYDNTKSEFISGLVRQIDQTPSDMQIAVKYTSNVNVSWSKIGGDTAVLNGTPTIVSGQLACSGAQGVVYETTANLYSIGTVKFKYTPNYTGSPLQNENMASIEQRSGVGNNRLILTHSPSGDNFRITLTEGNNNPIYTAAAIGSSGLNLQSGTQYEIELNWDSVTGIIRVFIGGNLNGSLSPGPWTFNSETMDLNVGATTNIYNSANASFDDVSLFDMVQHTANYTPGYTLLDFIYAENSLTLPIFTYSGPGLLRPAGAPTSTETGTPRYIVQGKYWDGAAWSNSNGSYAQSSSKADIVANIATFPTTGLSTITVILVFGDSNSLSTVDQIDFSVVGQAYDTNNPQIVPNSFTRVDGIESLTVTENVTGADAIKYIIERRSALGGQSSYFYWDGAAWATSDQTYAQSNTANEIDTNALSLDLTNGYYIRLVALLHSEDSFSTPELVSTALTYDFNVVPSVPNRVILYGWLRDAKSNPLVGTIYIDNVIPFKHSGLVFPKSRVSKDTDANGYFEFDGDDKLVETATVAKTYTIQINYTNALSEALIAEVTIPDQDSVNISDLIL